MDSDSDGIDSDDEGSVVGSDGSSSAAESDDGDSRIGPAARSAGSRSARVTGTAPGAPATPDAAASAPAGGEGQAETPPLLAAAPSELAGRRLEERGSSRRVRRGTAESAGGGQLQRRPEGASRRNMRASKGLLIKASYPAGMLAPPPAAAATAALGVMGSITDLLPASWRFRGPILSDSDEPDTAQAAVSAPQVMAASRDIVQTSLLASSHVDSAAAGHTSVAAGASQGAGKLQQPAAVAPGAPLGLLPMPFSRSKAAAVRRAVAGAAQAAIRAMTAAQTGAAAAGTAAVAAGAGPAASPQESRSDPIVLPSPRRAIFTSAGGSSPRSPAAVAVAGGGGSAAGVPAGAGGFAAASSHPEFPGSPPQAATAQATLQQGYQQQQQQKRQHSDT